MRKSYLYIAGLMLALHALLYVWKWLVPLAVTNGPVASITDKIIP